MFKHAIIMEKWKTCHDDQSFELFSCRTRMVVGVGSKHIAGSFLEIVGQYGWQGLWAGNAVNMLRIIPSQAFELATFESVKRYVISAQEDWDNKKEEDKMLKIGPINLCLSLSWISPVAAGGAAAGIASTLTCHPLEVLKVIQSWRFRCNLHFHYL